MNTLEEIAVKVKACQSCRLYEGRMNAVPGIGNSKAEIVFIGEGPGKGEDLQGEPFVGAAGKFFNILPLYHPAAALYNGGLRQTLISDFQKILQVISSLKK